MHRSWLYGLFFISGMSALIYELIWQRLLNLVFGASTLSVSAVLAGFMGGLALGGLIFGRIADRTTRPLGLYAWLEGGIGLTSFLVPPAFAALTTLYGHIYPSSSPADWAGTCLRFGIAFLVLLVPTTLMGGTLPLMGRLAARRTDRLPSAFSLLYGVNTLGAVVGAALTGFFLLRFLGMEHSLWLAAGLNLSVGFCAAIGNRVQETSHVVSDVNTLSTTDDGPSSASWIVLTCAGLTGAISMALEVAWARILGILTSNSAFGFALLLTVLLLGLAIGSLLQSWWSQVGVEHWRKLAICQWLLALITLGSVPFFRTTPEWLVKCCTEGSVEMVFLGELALTASALFTPALLMGMSLPLLVSTSATNLREYGNKLGRIYAANTIGGVVGASATGLLLVPGLGIQTTLALIISGTLVVGLAAWVQTDRLTRQGRSLGVAVVLTVSAAAWCLLPAGRYLKSPVLEPRRILFYLEGNNATVTVVEEEDGVRSILVDGQPVAGTVASSVVDQKMLAHLPLLLHPAPRRALTVGFGSGGTSYSMSLHGIEVDCVEIEGKVPAAADYFRSENHGILQHPRYRLIVDDARSWLRVAPNRYDVIATDCTNIQYRSNGDLYTVDYFRLLKERLTPDGLAAAWVPANGIGQEDLQTLLRSFRTVFPHTSVWYMNTLATDFLIVIGTPEALRIDLERLRERMQDSEIAQDLEAVGLTDPCRLIYTFLAGADDLSAFLGSGSLNTDDQPILSFSTYGATFRRTAAANLLQLLACRRDVACYVNQSAPPDIMLRHYAASNEVLLGHISYLAGAHEAARAHYARGAQLLSLESNNQN